MFFEQEKCALWWMVLVAFVVSAAPGRAQQVTLPLAEYESLRRRAEPPDVPQPPPPVPIVLESAEVDLSVGIDSARLTIRMTLAVYRDGWQTITLPGDGNLTSVELGTLDGRVSSGPSDSAPAERVLSCRGVGRHDIQFEAVVPVVSDVAAARPTRSVALTLPLAGTVTGVVQSDTVTDEIVLLSGAFAGDPSRQGARSFVGKPGEELLVQLLGESDIADETELPLFFEASSAAMTHVSRSGVELSLSSLPAHNSVDINFLLAIIDSWDGSSTFGPDFFNVEVDGVSIFRELFRNAVIPPILGPGGFGFNGTFADHGYDMGALAPFNGIAHSASTLTVNFFANGAGYQGGLDESFALENVQVIVNTTSNQVPEPTTIMLLGLGLAGLGFAKQRLN